MLTALTTGMRFRVALLLAAFAALCFVLPPAVMAFGHGKDTASCLAHADAVKHGMHKQPTGSDHSNHTPPPVDHSSTCCGLFCLSALATAVSQPLDPSSPELAPTPLADADPPGQAPGRLDRPPIALSV